MSPRSALLPVPGGKGWGRGHIYLTLVIPWSTRDRKRGAALFGHFHECYICTIRWQMSLTLLTLAYVTYQDIRKISGLKDQTVIVVKAPPETRLEVPDSIEVRRQRRGPSQKTFRNTWDRRITSSWLKSAHPKHWIVLSHLFWLTQSLKRSNSFLFIKRSKCLVSIQKGILVTAVFDACLSSAFLFRNLLSGGSDQIEPLEKFYVDYLVYGQIPPWIELRGL